MFSGWFLSNSGVRQGDSLSPTLFALFINALAEEIKQLNMGIDIDERNISILLYADDIVLIAENENKLQAMIDHMYQWCHKWKLKLNIEKSNIIHFRPRRKVRTDFEFHFGIRPLHIVDSYKYLGILLDEHLTYENCAKVLSDSAGRALGGIINKFKTLRDVGFKTFDKMYHTGVISVNNYASEIWGFKDFQCCKNVQNRAMRYYFGVHKFAPISGMQGDLGWLSARLRRFKTILSFWNKLIKMDDTRLTKHVFNYDHNKCLRNWSSDIKYVCNLLNINDVYDRKLCCDMSVVENGLHLVNSEQWMNDVNSKPKLRTYKRFKLDIGIEDYVKYNMSRKHRSLFSQFRFGILPLFVETGRFNNTPLTERICEFCNRNSIEDEFHFLIECDNYNEFRSTLFREVSCIIDNFNNLNEADKFIQLCTRAHKYVAKFIEGSFKKRKEMLYKNNI